jgi:hypothetical protein
MKGVVLCGQVRQAVCAEWKGASCAVGPTAAGFSSSTICGLMSDLRRDTRDFVPSTGSNPRPLRQRIPESRSIHAVDGLALLDPPLERFPIEMPFGADLDCRNPVLFHKSVND